MNYMFEVLVNIFSDDFVTLESGIILSPCIRFINSYVMLNC